MKFNLRLPQAAFRTILSLLLLLSGMAPLAFAQQNQSRSAGRFVASAYMSWRGSMVNGNTATGSQTITVTPALVTLQDGRTINPWSVTVPITVDLSGSASETVTPTAVSCNLSGGGQMGGICNITASFSNLHSGGGIANIMSGTFGLNDAVQDAFNSGGGVVQVDPSFAGTDVTMYAAIPFASVSIEDTRKGAVQYWNPAPNTTALATPTALTGQAACDATHTFCSDATVVGSASWGSTVFCGITYVDIMGNESLTSTTASFTSVASKAIDIGPPAASTGAVGWKPYCSLSGGTYALAYSLPLLTQPTVLLAVPVSAGVCTLTTLETVTPACALTNATYGQTSSSLGATTLFSGGGAQFTGYPVVTSMLAPNLDSASAQSLNPSNGGHTVYKYVPSSHVGIPGVTTVNQSFPITTAAQSTIGQVAGSIHLSPNFMNYVGRTIEVCGMLSKTSTTADTITNIQLWWDAEGSNVTAGTAVELSNIQITQTLTAAASLPFCQDITTTTAAATATGGTITPGMGWLTENQVAAGTIHDGGSNILFAAVGSLNLALNANIEVVYNHTTGTDGAGVLLINPTVKILN